MVTMNRLKGRLGREHRTLVCMTQIYCHHHHGRQGGGLCPDCDSLMQYAEKRLEKCPYGTDKPTCAKCPIHCYKPAQREEVRDIMRFAGPRMTWRHPIRSLTHLYDKLRQVEHPMKRRRATSRHTSMTDSDPKGQL
jgi:hypothetical protein